MWNVLHIISTFIVTEHYYCEVMKINCFLSTPHIVQSPPAPAEKTILVLSLLENYFGLYLFCVCTNADR